MNESAHVFGQYDHLLGVCTSPGKNADAKATGVLILTAGMLHNVGPFGLHVSLARRLSEMGFYSLRFCLSGIGESFGVGADGSSTQRAVNEARQAMDLMEANYGLKRFITFGLCSGADDSVNVALQDDRVVGTVLMDGCGYRTRGYQLRKHLWHRPLKLLHRLRGLSQGAALFYPRTETGSNSTLAAGDDIREFPDRQTAESEFQTLVDRGVRMMLLYTGGVADYFNGERQFKEMFPQLRDGNKIELRYFPKLDHIAKLVEDRELVVGEVASWISRWRETLPVTPVHPTITDRIQEDCICPILVPEELSGSLGFPLTLQ